MLCTLKEFVRTVHTVKSVKLANSIRNHDERVVEQIRKMMQHFETYNFLNIRDNNSIQFDFNSENLKEVIRSEWLFNNVVLCDQPSFYVSQLNEEENFKSAFQNIKGLVNSLPFSLVEINCNNSKTMDSQLKPQATNLFDLVKNLFSVFKGTSLRNLTFCSPQVAVEFFHKQQRERKIWWRKFSAQPGRYHTTKIYSKDKSQCVEIQAEFPWGFETIETISYLPDIPTSDPSFFEMKNQRKKFIPHLVTCEASLDRMTLTYLCDSYQGFTEENDSEVLRFCRKLAPYKVAFVGFGTSAETTQNLKGLAQLLAMKIRKCGISVLCLPDSISVDRQIARNDALGVPFTIILNENTLKDGIIAVRNRDTTLKEQSHVSLIVSHTENLMKSL